MLLILILLMVKTLGVRLLALLLASMVFIANTQNNLTKLSLINFRLLLSPMKLTLSLLVMLEATALVSS